MPDSLRDVEDAMSKRGVTWLANGECPKCGSHDIIGFLLVDEEGRHAHTKYRCTRWVNTMPREQRRVDISEDWGYPCGWEDWSVPGWDTKEAGDIMNTPAEDDQSKFGLMVLLFIIGSLFLSIGMGVNNGVGDGVIVFGVCSLIAGIAIYLDRNEARKDNAKDAE